jgi:hypothetical protein
MPDESAQARLERMEDAWPADGAKKSVADNHGEIYNKIRSPQQGTNDKIVFDRMGAVIRWMKYEVCNVVA